MTRYFRRTEPGVGENIRAGLVAGAVAGSVAVVSFYLVRLFLAREPLESLDAPTPAGGALTEPDGNEA